MLLQPSESTIRCVFCLMRLANVRFDRKGRPFFRCGGCGVRAFMSSLSSLEGLAFGGVAAAFLLFAALLGIRKRLRTWHLGRMESWLKGHVWLGLLTLPLVLFHSGFHVGGALTTVLMVLLVTTIATGVYGLVVQRLVPRTLLVRGLRHRGEAGRRARSPRRFHHRR